MVTIERDSDYGWILADKYDRAFAYQTLTEAVRDYNEPCEIYVSGRRVAAIEKTGERFAAVGYYPEWTRNWGDQMHSGGWKTAATASRAVNSFLRRIGVDTKPV